MKINDIGIPDYLIGPALPGGPVKFLRQTLFSPRANPRPALQTTSPMCVHRGMHVDGGGGWFFCPNPQPLQHSPLHGSGVNKRAEGTVIL